MDEFDPGLKRIVLVEKLLSMLPLQWISNFISFHVNTFVIFSLCQTVTLFQLVVYCPKADAGSHSYLKVKRQLTSQHWLILHSFKKSIWFENEQADSDDTNRKQTNGSQLV